MVAALGLGIAALLWYRQANARFIQRILGYDATRPPDDVKALWRLEPRVAEGGAEDPPSSMTCASRRTCYWFTQ